MAFDVAVFGSSAASMLVAGLLRQEHGKSVVVVADAWSPWLLPRRFDLALLPATRPQTWRLLKAGIAETSRLIKGIGKNLVGRTDPVLIAERPATLRAIAHMKASLGGYGFVLDQVADRSLSEPAAAWCLRGAARLEDGAPLAISDWMERQEVRLLRPHQLEITIRRDGAVRFGGKDGFEAQSSVLMDDEALLRHLPSEEIERLFRAVPACSIRTEPAAALTAPWLSYLDRGVTLTQSPGKSMPVDAVVTGDTDLDARLGSTLAAQAPLRRVAESRFTRLETTDGAPLVTQAKAPRSLVVAGFGDAAAFFAPALARRIAGASTDDEADYFAAHELGRGSARQAIADFVAEPV